jgi:Na+/phosphate symporter
MDVPSEAAAAPGQSSSVRAHERAGSSAISQAVNEVMQIVESLKQALHQMEDVLELVEHAERQKLADEHEIESLRRLLRQLQHPGSGRGERREQNV